MEYLIFHFVRGRRQRRRRVLHMAQEWKIHSNFHTSTRFRHFLHLVMPYSRLNQFLSLNENPVKRTFPYTFPYKFQMENIYSNFICNLRIFVRFLAMLLFCVFPWENFDNAYVLIYATVNKKYEWKSDTTFVQTWQKHALHDPWL